MAKHGLSTEKVRLASARKKKKQDLDPIRSNPFERRKVSKKFDVIGSRQKVNRKSLGKARTEALEKRTDTISVEYKGTQKKNAFIDKRIGEHDSSMSHEDKMMARFQRERQKLIKTSKYALEEVGQFENLGNSLGGGEAAPSVLLEDDYEASDHEGFESDGSNAMTRLPEMNEEEDDYESTKPWLQGLPHLQNENGVDSEGNAVPRHKSRKDIMSEVMAKSKFYKQLHKEERNEEDEMREKLDEAYDDELTCLLGSWAQELKRGERTALSLAALTGANGNGSGSGSGKNDGGQTQTQTEVRLKEPGEMEDEKNREKEEKGSWDRVMGSLRLDKRSAPSDRMLSPEERAAQLQKKLRSWTEERHAARSDRAIDAAANGEDEDNWEGLSDDSDHESHIPSDSDGDSDSGKAAMGEASAFLSVMEGKAKKPAVAIDTSQKHPSSNSNTNTDTSTVTVPTVGALDQWLATATGPTAASDNVAHALLRLIAQHHPRLGDATQVRLLPSLCLQWVRAATETTVEEATMTAMICERMSMVHPALYVLSRLAPEQTLQAVRGQILRCSQALSRATDLTSSPFSPMQQQQLLVPTVLLCAALYPLSDAVHPIAAPLRILWGACLGALSQWMDLLQKNDQAKEKEKDKDKEKRLIRVIAAVQEALLVTALLRQQSQLHWPEEGELVLRALGFFTLPAHVKTLTAATKKKSSELRKVWMALVDGCLLELIGKHWAQVIWGQSLEASLRSEVEKAPELWPELVKATKELAEKCEVVRINHDEREQRLVHLSEHRAKSIASLQPLIVTRENDRSKDKRASLKRAHKKAMKGAIRELRKDAAVVREIRDAERHAEEAVRAKRLKTLMSDLHAQNSKGF
jgi:hypothetical protein